MPSDATPQEPALSELLRLQVETSARGLPGSWSDTAARLMAKASAYIARREQAEKQPEVEELRSKASTLRMLTDRSVFHVSDWGLWADHLEAHASSIVALSEARAENQRLRDENERVQREAGRMIRESEGREAEARATIALVEGLPKPLTGMRLFALTFGQLTATAEWHEWPCSAGMACGWKVIPPHSQERLIVIRAGSPIDLEPTEADTQEGLRLALHELTAALRGEQHEQPPGSDPRSALNRDLTGADEARQSPWLVRVSEGQEAEDGD